MCKGTQSSIHFLWGAMLSFRAVQQSIQQPNVLPAIASCVCVCFLFLSLNFLLVKGRHRDARSQIPLAAMTNNQWNQLRNAKWQQTCVFVCVIPLQTIFTLKALAEMMNLLSHPTIKDVHHYSIASCQRSLVPQTYNKRNLPPVEELTIPSRRLEKRNSWDTSSTKYNHISISIIPGSSVRDLFGGFIRDLFRGENVTSIWGIKTSLGRSWFMDLLIMDLISYDLTFFGSCIFPNSHWLNMLIPVTIYLPKNDRMIRTPSVWSFDPSDWQ